MKMNKMDVQSWKADIPEFREKQRLFMPEK